MNLDNVEASDFEKFLEVNPHLKDYKVEIPEPGVAVLSKENFPSVQEQPAETPQLLTPPIFDVIRGPSIKIQIQKSSIHNYGVFALEDINEGEEIEQCRLLRLAWRAKYHGDPAIKDYVWTNMHCKCKECQMHGPQQYIALGFGSIYNHSDDQNTTVNLDYKNELMTVKAKRFIPKGSEIFVNYGNNYWKIRQKKESSDETKETKISESETKE